MKWFLNYCSVLMLILIVANSYRIPITSYIKYSSKNNRIIKLSSSSSNIPEVGDTNDDSETAREWGQVDEYPVVDPWSLYPANASDAEVIEAMKIERLLENDRWQSYLFRDNQCDEWDGYYDTYIPVRDSASGGNVDLDLLSSGALKTSMSMGEITIYGVDIKVKEEYKPNNEKPDLDNNMKNAISLLHKETRSSYQPVDFRLTNGNSVVANVFTLSRTESSSTPSLPESYVAELGIGEGKIRTRVRYAYTKQPTAALNVAANEDKQYEMSFAGLTIIREAKLDISPDEVQPLIDQTVGPGIYDPQAKGEPYVQLNLPGFLSILFPRALKNDERQTMCVEWQGNKMRFQTDRCFLDVTGAIKTLELTEIAKENAQKYPGGGFNRDVESGKFDSYDIQFNKYNGNNWPLPPTEE